ncbi:MAG: DUF4325 domain-containing protein [Candidatus Peribacteraceae bacterium]
MEQLNPSIGDFIIENLPAHSSDIVHLISKNFNISRQKAHKHLLKQVQQGKVIRTGKTRATRYFLASGDHIEFEIKNDDLLEEDRIWSRFLKPRMSHLSKNVYDICQFGFTEILNNAKDHSEGKNILCRMTIENGKIILIVMDDGVGIFQKIQNALHLTSIREAVLHLSKGKFTTDPEKHTGLGIFFTSRIFDQFGILSSDMYYIFHEGDWLLAEERKQDETGTFIKMEINVASRRVAREVFDQYADTDEDVGFHKTIVSVRLSADANDPHVSRSQAKRLLMGLDRFRNIILDFKNVQTVGQPFVDEVFRVFQNQHPNIQITWLHASPDVESMIKRGIAERDQRKINY